MERMDINIIVGNPDDRMIEAFFGKEDVMHVPETMDMPTVLTEIVPVFKSKTQARKAGWGEIPEGFKAHVIGKFKHEVWTFKEVTDDQAENIS